MKRKVSTIWTEAEMLKLRCVLPESASKSIAGIRGPYNSEYRPIWRELTPGERTFLLVFWGAFERRHYANLFMLCRGDRAKTNRIMTELKKDHEYARADLTTVTAAQVAVDIKKRDTKRLKHDYEGYDHRGWTREDVPAEVVRDDEPQLGHVKLSPIQLPEYDRPPAPVRRVSAEEYDATKRPPKYGGVKLPFNKESTFWTKEISRMSDKINEGLESPPTEKETMLSARDCGFQIRSVGNTHTVQVMYFYRSGVENGVWHDVFKGFTTPQDAKAALRAIKRFANEVDTWDDAYQNGPAPRLDERLMAMYTDPPYHGPDIYEEVASDLVTHESPQEIAGYDDPRHEDGAYDPRYSPE